MKSAGNSGMDARIYCEKTNPPLYHTGADLLIGTRKSSGYFLNLLPGVVVVHVINLLFPYTANIYAHVMENADRKNADILADVFLKKA